MSENLKLQITGALDKNKSIESINKNIKELEKSSLLKDLKLNITVDNNALNVLKNFSKQMEKIKAEALGTGKYIKEVLNPDGSKTKQTWTGDLAGEFKQTDTAAKPLKATLEQQSKTVEELRRKYALLTKEVDNYNSKGKKVGSTLSLTNADKSIGATVKLDTNGELISYKETNKQSEILSKNTTELISKISRLHTEGKITSAQFKELSNSMQGLGKTEGINSINKKMNDYTLATKNANKSAKEYEVIQERIRKLSNSIISAQNKNPTTLGSNTNLTAMLTTLQQLDPKSKNASSAVKGVSDNFDKMKASATSAGRDSLTMLDSLKIALQKFPIWMAASTLFFGVTRSAKEFGTIIIDIDTKMTNLSKVMSDDVDLESVFERGVASAEKFGQSVSASLDAYTEFARQGFEAGDLNVLADAGLVASNVGEITSQRASEYLTASIIQWKMETKDAMGIVDSWNEISNNYATTVEKLASGQAKAGATARSMGLDFNQLNAIVGTVTASTKQSGSEIGNFVKAVLPRLLGKPGQAALGSLGINLTDSEGNLRDIIDVYSEVAEKVKGISDSERVAITEGLAGKFHIARMQLFLDDLGQADSMYQKMYESSVNSAGSAMDENEKFMESLQARINLARVEVEKLSLAIGGAFLTEGMIQGLQVFGSALGGLTKFVDKFGLLPVLLGTAGVALFLVSSSFKGLVGSVTSSIVSLSGYRGAVTQASVASGIASSAVTRLGIAFKGLMASTGVGLALVGVGYAIEKLLGSMAKQRAIQEEISQENIRLADTYETNRQSIQSLKDEYTKLESAMQVSPDVETQNRYYEVQSELVALMPDLLAYEDSYGNKMVGSSAVIESKIGLLEKQIETEEKLQKIQQATEDAETLEANKKIVVDKNEKANVMFDYFKVKANNGMGNEIYDYQGEIKNLQDMEQAIKYFEEQRLVYAENGRQGVSKKMGKISEELQGNLDTYERFLSESESAQSYITKVAIDNAEKTILANTEIEDSTKDLANSMLYDFATMAKTSQEAESISDIFGDGDFQKSLEDASKQINSFTNSSSDDFEKQKKNFLEYAETMKETMRADMKDSNGAPLKKDSEAYINVGKSIDTYVDKLILQEQKVREVMEVEGQSREEALLSIQSLGDLESGVEGLNETLSEYVSKLYEKASAEESVSGVTQKLLDEADSLIFLYKTLSDQTNLTASQSLALKDAQEKLASIYPQLSKNGEIRIDSIIAERNAQDILLKAVKASKDGQLSVEEQATVGHLLETNSRISIINAEIVASQKLADAYASVYESVVSAAEGGSESAAKLLMRISVPTVKAQIAQAELATLEKSRGGYVNSLSGSLDELAKSTDKSSSATEKSAKENERASFVADKYTLSLEKINMALKEQQRIQEDFPDFSKQYRDSLEAEIKLNKDKTALLKEQATSLENQIKSGKILETGVIKSSSGSAYSGKYATEINKASSTYGVDANLIAAIIKQESNFNAKAMSHAGAKGLMQLMPGTAKELGVKDSYNVEQNIMGGTKYIAQQLTKFGGDIQKALYAYNAGAGNVSKILSSSSKEWKGAKDYASKIMANLATVSNNAVETAKLNGWSGKVTSGFGMRNDPITGKRTQHNGIDIAGNKGDRLDSNVSGKVTFAGKGSGSMSGFGNYVAIETADGLKHFYAHLDKVIAKVGDTVAVGSQIGNIGSTGKSTGNHLHYQVNKNGKPIDPTVTASLANTMSVDAANGLKSIEDAKSQLLNLQGQLVDTNEAIEELESKIIQSYLAEFENNRSLFQDTLDFESAKQEAMSKTGKEYRASIDKQVTALNGQQSANQKELNFLNDLIKNGNLSAVAMTEMKDRVKALNVEMLQLANTIQNTEFEKITSRQGAFDEDRDDLQYLIDLTGEYMGSLTEGSKEYNAAANDQIATMKKLQRSYKTQIEEHKTDLLTKKLSAQETKDLKETIEDLTISYYSLGNGIRSSTESLVEANKRMENETADKLIEIHKKYNEERKTAHMKTIDAEMKAEEKRHKQISDNLSKELDAYKKIIQAKLDMLNKEESDRDYNKEIDKLEKEKLDINNKINLLSIDSSFEAKKETASLEEKLKEIEDQILEKRHDREIELRKENLDDLLTSKEEDVKARQELEDERYEHEKELIDKQKEYWEQYYDDLINDERKFAKLRKDIVDGNTEEIKAEFGEILDYFKETMPNLEIELEGTMDKVGTSIRKNMIDNLKEALDLMNKIGTNTSTPTVSGGQFNADKNVNKPNSSDNVPASLSGWITIEKPINLWKRKRGSDEMEMARILKPGEKYEAYGYENKFGGQYDVGGGYWITNMKDHIKFASADVGGMTSSWSGSGVDGKGGKNMIVHPDELISNPLDTKRLFGAANVLDRIMSNLPKLITPTINSSNPSLNGGLTVTFNVDKMVANDKEADTFSKRIGDNLKRLKGMK